MCQISRQFSEENIWSILGKMLHFLIDSFKILNLVTIRKTGVLHPGVPSLHNSLKVSISYDLLPNSQHNRADRLAWPKEKHCDIYVD